MPTGAESRLQGLLIDVTREAMVANCEAMLAMVGHGVRADRVMRQNGFFASPERYDLLVWPRAALEHYPVCGDAARWRFSFGDHDAF